MALHDRNPCRVVIVLKEPVSDILRHIHNGQKGLWVHIALTNIVLVDVNYENVSDRVTGSLRRRPD